MANIKSAKKRILVAEKRAEKNKSVRSRVKTAVKKVDAAIAANDKVAAEAALKAAVSELDKATKKGIYHKNTTARKVSRLTIAVNKLSYCNYNSTRRMNRKELVNGSFFFTKGK